MTLVIIRHADRKYNNNDGYHRRLDSPIKEEEWERGKQVLRTLIRKYNIFPTKIVSSPFRRTRDTARILIGVMKELKEESGDNPFIGDPLNIEISKGFAGYLGWQKSIKFKDFYYETNKYGPFKQETMKQYKERILNELEQIKRSLQENEIVWIITHNCAIHTILESYGIIPGHTAPFAGAIINKEEVILI